MTVFIKVNMVKTSGMGCGVIDDLATYRVVDAVALVSLKSHD
jgi:hypothetical protein